MNQDSIDAANRARAAEARAREVTARMRAILEAKVFFDYDKSALRDDSKKLLDDKIPIMQANPNVRIRIEGNADERGSRPSTIRRWGCAGRSRRWQYLVSKGIAEGRIDLASNGEEKPVQCSNIYRSPVGRRTAAMSS